MAPTKEEEWTKKGAVRKLSNSTRNYEPREKIVPGRAKDWDAKTKYVTNIWEQITHFVKFKDLGVAP